MGLSVISCNTIADLTDGISCQWLNVFKIKTPSIKRGRRGRFFMKGTMIVTFCNGCACNLCVPSRPTVAWGGQNKRDGQTESNRGRFVPFTCRSAGARFVGATAALGFVCTGGSFS